MTMKRLPAGMEEKRQMIFLATWRLAIRGQRSDLAVSFHYLGTSPFPFCRKD